ncbi:MAG: hypothetical protein Q7S74_00725 [Nanoarchaeota archaeon]|nr:hypothetical protein [Nanoarchaeota archaeon]
MQKRGLSGIVVSVLLVLLVMVAVAIIWFSIRPLLQRAGQQTQDELQFNSLSFTIRNIKVDSQNNIDFVLQRNAGKGKVIGFIVVVEDNTKKISTITKYNTTSLEELQTIPIHILAAEHGLTGKIIKISVYAVVLSTDISISIVSSNPVATAVTGSGSGEENDTGNLFISFDYNGSASLLSAYSNVVVVAVNISAVQPIYLMGNYSNETSFVVNSLPDHGMLKDASNNHALSSNDLPYMLNGGNNLLFYIPNNNYEGADNFSFFLISNNFESVGKPEMIYLEVSLHVLTKSYFNYQVLIDNINESRWQQKNITSLNAIVVNRSVYLTYIIGTFKDRGGNGDNLYLSDVGKNSTNINHFYAYEYIKQQAFFYRALGNGNDLLHNPPIQNINYINRTLGFMWLLYNVYTNPNYSAPSGRYLRRSDGPIMAEGYLWIHNYLTQAQKDEARDYLLTYEKSMENELLWSSHAHEIGADAAGFGPGTTIRLINYLYPNSPNVAGNDNRTWYTNAVWDSWYQYADFNTNSYNYNGLVFMELNTWIETLNDSERSSVYNDPRVKELISRYLNYASPLGFIATYGDNSGGVNNRPGYWTAFFEKWASAYEGRDDTLSKQLRWVAHRTFEWTKQRVPSAKVDIMGTDYIKQDSMTAFMSAWMYASDNSLEQIPNVSSVVTYRHGVRILGLAERSISGYPAYVLPEIIPDKLILRNGWQPDSFYAMIELAPALGHGHCDTGGISSLISNASVLLSYPGYTRNAREFHNTFQLKGVTDKCYELDYGKQYTTVPEFVDNNMMSYAVIDIENYTGNPAQLRRRFIFSKEGILWVSDTITARSALSVDVGPAWQTLSIYGAQGSNWFNTAFQTVPSMNIGGRYYLNQWQNIPWDLLIIFPNMKGRVVTDYVGSYNHAYLGSNTERYRIWNKEHVNLTSGQNRIYNSVLIPHSPSPDSTLIAQNTKIVLENESVSVLRIAQSANSVEYMGFNDDNATIDFDQISTNAHVFILKFKDGVLDKYSLEDVSYLKIKDKVVINSSSRKSEGSF